MATPEGAPDLPLAVGFARALMERHGLPKYRQSAWLASALGLSYSQAHRRMNGTSPWSLEDLAQLAGLFNETLQDLIGHRGDQGSVVGRLRVGSETINCQLWLGDTIADPRTGAIFAVKTDAGWTVVTSEEAPEGDRFEIVCLEASPAASQRHSVAVLDDDTNITNSIVTSFEMLGFKALGFYNVADLLTDTVATRFDCFVLDWVVGDSTVLEVVRSLRAANGSCPIVILTAQVSTGAINETDIADAMRRYDLLFCEKPVRVSILAAMLNRAFSATATRQAGG